VLVRGKLAPIVGCFDGRDHVDVTDLPDVAIGDAVTIYGTAGSEVLPANRVARGIGRSPRPLVRGERARASFYMRCNFSLHTCPSAVSACNAP